MNEIMPLLPFWKCPNCGQVFIRSLICTVCGFEKQNEKENKEKSKED